MSISTELYPKLDLWTANKLHYITVITIGSGRLYPSASWRFFCSPKHLRRVLGPSKLPIYWVPGLFAWGKVARALS